MPSADRRPVLYLTHRVPYPPDKGDRIRAYHLARFIAAHAPLHLGCLADEPVSSKQTAALEQLAARVTIVPLEPRLRWLRGAGSLATGGTISEGVFQSPALSRVVDEWTQSTEYRSVIISASSLASYLQRPGLRKTPAVVDLVDVDSQKWLDYAAASKPPKRWLYATEGHRLRKLERRLLDQVRAVTLVSKDEAELLRRSVGDGPIHAISNGVDLDYFSPQGGAEAGAGLVFVGALDYRPNIDGAVWFCERVWPTLRARQPSLTLSLVGRNPSPAVKNLSREPGVNVVGTVPDVRPYVARAAVVVVPLLIARGVQNKVLEALAMAKPVVAAPGPLVGIDAKIGTEVIEAGSPEEWVAQIERLLVDAALRQSIGAAGREFVVRAHHWDRCLDPIRPLLDLD